MTDYHLPPSLPEFEVSISAWLAGFAAGNPTCEAIDRGAAGEPEPWWYVRLRGDEKEHITIWLTLGQRTLRYEAYVLPAPQENVAAVYEMALRRNDRLVGAHFAIGVEDALFLRGEMPLAWLDEAELDRIIGSPYSYTEQAFPSLVRLAFARKFALFRRSRLPAVPSTGAGWVASSGKSCHPPGARRRHAAGPTGAALATGAAADHRCHAARSSRRRRHRPPSECAGPRSLAR